jgi:[acyl-carrier-protein] S-malonyltransferase
VTCAFLFPGQAVAVGAAAAEWHARSGTARGLLDRAAERAGTTVARVLHAGSGAFDDTAVYQPVVTALCVGAFLEVRARGVAPDVVAGHSLGELAACVAAGVLTPEAAVDVAATRGAAMARAAGRRPGGMVALRVNSREAALEAAEGVAALGRVEIAAHNAADEWVLSGDWAALRALPARFAPVALATDGPWHSSAMEPAVAEYRAALLQALHGRPRLTLVSNATGSPVGPGDDLVELLAGQLTRPVEWAATLATLSGMAVERFVTIGPAKALRGLARRGLGRGVRLEGVDVPEDLPAVAGALVV